VNGKTITQYGSEDYSILGEAGDGDAPGVRGSAASGKRLCEKKNNMRKKKKKII
jgi:hypothetical protein